MSQKRTVSRAPGFVDLVGPDLLAFEAAAAVARHVLTARGFVPISTPIVEQSELFLRKSGGVLSSQMYGFDAPDGASLSLRPELTAPVIRHALENPDGGYPKRFQYAGPVFRYPDRTDEYDAEPLAGPRQFTQIGAELLGDASATSDGEVVAAACEVARAVGFPEVSVKFGHVGLVWSLLRQFELPRRAELFIASNLDGLKNGSTESKVEERARQMSLLGSADGDLDGTTATLGGPLRPAWEFAKRLANISGTVQSSFSALASLCTEFRLDFAGAVTEANNVIDATKGQGVDSRSLSIDLGMSVGMAYYTGMVFEIGGDTTGDQQARLGGGGRYDGLAEALGAESRLPALGFALNLTEMLDALAGDADSGPPRQIR